MSTSALVAIKEGNFYTFMRNNHDSYIDDLGIKLYKHYKEARKVNELVLLGDTLSVGHGPELKYGTKAYYRDEKLPWNECSFDVTTNIEDLFHEEYVYIFNTETNKWSFWYWKDKKVRDLEEVLHSKKLLEEIFFDTYLSDYLPRFYDDCLSA